MHCDKIDGATVLAEVCAAVAADELVAAAAILRGKLPLQPVPRVNGSVPLSRRIAVFLRDGFICRYSGQRVLLPAAMMLLAKVLPEQFPWHQNWRMDVCHSAFWELSAEVDHIEPRARRGTHNIDNLVTVTPLVNKSKAHSHLSSLAWSLHPVGSLHEWDGKAGWFLAEAQKRPKLLTPMMRETRRLLERMPGTRFTRQPAIDFDPSASV
jgi:hypothetical protein